MKKIISFCLVITVIMGMINYGTVEVLANSISESKASDSTISKSDSTESQPDIEETEVTENKDSNEEDSTPSNDKVLESEKAEVSENKNLEAEEKNTLDDKEVEQEKASGSEDEVETLEEEVSNQSKAGSKIEVNWGGNDIVLYNTIKEAIDDANAKFSEYIKLKFLVDYTMSSDDITYLQGDIKAKGILFESLKNVKLIFPKISNPYLTFNHNGNTSHKLDTVQFININLEFKTNWHISGNGVRLHMSEGVNMIGDIYPSLYGGTALPGNSSTITKDIYIMVESGTYEKIYPTEEKYGRKIKNLTLDFKGGYIKQIGGVDKGKQEGIMTLNLYGGKVDEIRDNRTSDSSDYGQVTVNINGIAEVGKIHHVRYININNSSKLVLTGSISYGNTTSETQLVIDNGGTLEIKDNGNVDVGYMTINKNSTLMLPGNRNKNNTPLKISVRINGTINGVNLKLSTNTSNTLDEFYLINVKNSFSNNLIKGITIADESIFYIDKLENIGTISYIKGKKKENGPLIYDVGSGEFKYIDKNHVQQSAWWINKNSNDEFMYDDLVKHNNGYVFVNRDNVELKITGTGSNRNIKINNDKSDNKKIKIIIESLDAKNSEFSLKNIESININGENTINSPNASNTIFTYSFANSGGNEKVVAKDDKSYLKIFTDIATDIFDGTTSRSAELAYTIDFQFNVEFKNTEKVRLEATDGSGVFSFDIPRYTQRMGILFGNLNKNKSYNLYHGVSGNTGTSVYVSGNTESSFKERFTPSNNHDVYEYVRRANPVKRVNVDISNKLDFEINTELIGLAGVFPSDWKKYFKTTDMTIKNESIDAKDKFEDENGDIHYFGKKSVDVEIGYLGVSPSNTMSNGIELVDANALDNNTSGAKVALKFVDGQDEVPLDENKGQLAKPLKTWNIQSEEIMKLEVQPNFNTYKKFFYISNNSKSDFNSLHNINFRVELKAS